MRKRYWLHQMVGTSFLLLAVAGCGDKLTAPSGSAISISPDSFAPPADTSSATSTHSQYFTISLKDADGKPLKNREISIFFPYAVPDSSSYAQLYDGSTPKNSPFTANTNMDGVYYLRIDYLSGGGISYSGNLEIRSGSVFGSATITIS